MIGGNVRGRPGAVAADADDVTAAAAVVVEVPHRIREAEPRVGARIRVGHGADDVSPFVERDLEIADERRRAEDLLEFEEAVHGNRPVEQVLARVLRRARVADEGRNRRFDLDDRGRKVGFLDDVDAWRSQIQSHVRVLL